MRNCKNYFTVCLRTYGLFTSTPTQVRCLSLTFRKMDEAMEHLQNNPFYAKYAQKIDKVKLNHPVELVNAVNSRKAETSMEASSAVGAAAIKPISTPSTNPKTPLSAGAVPFVPQKKLESIMKTELLQDKTAEEVTFLWNQHWQNYPGICGVMEAALYDSIRNTAATYNRFLFALPRNLGFEFFLAQFAAHEIHFTSLINYQTYKENAPECLTMVHYTEFKERLGIVLMRGEYDSKYLSGRDAQYLANQVQLYYSGRDQSKMALVKFFHERPQDFTETDLIKEFDHLDFSAMQLSSVKK
ncbi:ATP11 [Trinorchestia longiramus]|nr:ATP11 [Trinorchestia longiramus]